MRLVLMAVLVFGVLFNQPALSDPTSPVSVEASSTYFSYTLADLINQDGISGGLDGGTHGELYFTMWLSDTGDVTPQLVFDMGEEGYVDAALIWQYNAVCCGLDRGVNEFEIYYSTDDIDYTYYGSANLSVSAGGNIFAQSVPTGFFARYIRFDVVSNYGHPLYTGLSEVAFDFFPAVAVDIDIKFCSDPNAFNCKKKGVLPVTVFGTADFDVAEIDVATLQLCLADGVTCTNAPLDASTFDRGTPGDAGVAQCDFDPDTGEALDFFIESDGYPDLDVAFDASEVQSILGDFCAEGAKGDVSEALVIIGETYDGVPIYSEPADDNTGIDRLVKVNK